MLIEMGKKTKNKEESRQAPPGVYAPYGGKWWNGQFYTFVEPDAKLTRKQINDFEKWVKKEEKLKSHK